MPHTIGPEHFEVPELRHENHNRQAIHKTEHHRMRHHANQLAQLGGSKQQLQQAHQNHGGKQVLHTMLDDQRNHDHRQGARRAGDHAGPTAKGCGDQTNDEGCIQSGQGADMGDQCEGDGLRHQGEGNGQAAEDVRPQIGGTQLEHAVPIG